MTWRRKGAGADEAPGAQGGERTAAKNPFFAKRIQRSLIALGRSLLRYAESLSRIAAAASGLTAGTR